MNLRRPLSLAALAALLLTLLTTAPALAHTELEKSNPARGASLSTPPATISLTFGEAVKPAADAVRVTGPGGVAWTLGKATATDATVTAPVTAATGPAGAYTITWKVVADDGDALTGTIPFTLTTAATPTTTPAAPTTTAAAPIAEPAPAAQQASTGGVPAWVWVLGGLVMAAVVAGVLVRVRRG